MISERLPVKFIPINDDYYRAEYHGSLASGSGFELIIMKDNGYANATKLCGHADKKMDNWSRLHHSLIDAYTQAIGTSAKIVVRTGIRETHGTYLHPDINLTISTNTSLRSVSPYSVMDFSTTSHHCK